MGSGSFNPGIHEEFTRAHGSGASAFGYSNSLGNLKKVHPSLDPNGVKVRESRDSDEHPESVAIAVFFDVTGSMHNVPVVLQTKLPELMGLLLRKGYVDHPQIMFGAIGDAYSDQVPLQVGQFESDNVMNENMTNMVLEGGGGGGNHESYQLAAYFLARHTDTDCWNKRGHKGYVFIIGDERVYKTVDRHQVEELIGDNLPEGISTQEIFRELQERYEVFYLFATQGSYTPDEVLPEEVGQPDCLGWRPVLGQNALVLEDAEAVCEVIALNIGVMEGRIDLDEGAEDLREFGVNEATIGVATRALADVANSRAVAKAGTGGKLPGMPDGPSAPSGRI